MSSRRPVVTGLGILTAAGCGVSAMWDALRAGRSGLGPLTLFASPRYGRHQVGQVRENVDQLAGDVRGSRSDKLAWIAAREAIQQAGLAMPLNGRGADRAGVLLGSTVAGMLGTEEVVGRMLRENLQSAIRNPQSRTVPGGTPAAAGGTPALPNPQSAIRNPQLFGTEEVPGDLLRRQPRRFTPLRYHECASATDLCARQLGARGPTATFSTACSAGALAIATAAGLIEDDELDVALAGGADSLSRLTLNGFGALLLLDADGCRPFDAARAGISLGEGAAMLVIEAEETARARGARILARLTGWGASCDASHPTAPDPQGGGATAAMQQALERGGLSPSDIGFVLAHGTGTPDNDVMEARALRRVFDGAVPPFASVKRFFGHTLAASGAIQAVAAVQALREQAAPANLGFENSDPEIGLRPAREFQARPLQQVLSNSFGFGGNNVALVFGREDPLPASAACGVPGRSQKVPLHGSDGNYRTYRTYRTYGTYGAAGGPGRSPGIPLAVIGAGLVSAGGHTMAGVRSALAAGGVTPSWLESAAPFPLGRLRGYSCGDFGADEAIPAARRRRLGRLQQMALVAAKRSLPQGLPAGLSPERVCAAIGTGLGCLGETAAFVENMLIHGERAPLAGRFANSVHNACASQLAIEFNLRGLNSTSTHREISFEAALWHCAGELRQGRADMALAGAADELSPYTQAAGERWGWWDGNSPAIRPFGRELTGRRRPLPGEGAAVFALARGDQASAPLARLQSVHFGRFAARPGGQPEAQQEAAWLRESLERDGVPLASVDLLLAGASGWPRWDDAYREVASALSVLRGEEVRLGAYKQVCGEHYSASAFGFFVALGLVGGQIEPALCLAGIPSPAAGARSPRTVLLYTLSPGGSHALCCVCA